MYFQSPSVRLRPCSARFTTEEYGPAGAKSCEKDHVLALAAEGFLIIGRKLVPSTAGRGSSFAPVMAAIVLQRSTVSTMPAHTWPPGGLRPGTRGPDTIIGTWIPC